MAKTVRLFTDRRTRRPVNWNGFRVTVGHSHINRQNPVRGSGLNGVFNPHSLPTFPLRWRKVDSVEYKLCDFSVSSSNMATPKYTLNPVIVAQYVKNCESWYSLSKKLQVQSRYLKRCCEKHGIDTSHLLKKTGSFVRKDIYQYLIKGKTISTSALRNRLIKEGIKKHICERCKRTEWEGQIIPIELHHIDGDNINNVLTNLQILCPNCHSLTPNHCGANIKKNPKRRSPEEYRNAIVSSQNPAEACVKLGINPVGGNLGHVKTQASKLGLVFPEIENIANIWIEKEQKKNKITLPKIQITKCPEREKLIELIANHPLKKIGEMFAVSDNAVKRWAKKYQIPLLPAGYWIRRYNGFSHEESITGRGTRPMRRHFTQEEAQLALNSLNEGRTLRYVAKILDTAHETVKDILARYNFIPKGWEPCINRHKMKSLKKIRSGEI